MTRAALARQSGGLTVSLNEHMASSYIASALACQICTQQPLQTVTGVLIGFQGQRSIGTNYLRYAADITRLKAWNPL